MAEYFADEQVHAQADALFDYLADIGNLPKYFPRMTSAESAGGDKVRVTAKIDSDNDGETREVEGQAWLRVDRDGKSLSWGSEGPNDYHGELTVRGVGDNSGVAIRLSTERVETDDVQHGLNETVANIKRLVEGDGESES